MDDEKNILEPSGEVCDTYIKLLELFFPKYV